VLALALAGCLSDRESGTAPEAEAGERVTAVALGVSHACAVTDEGRVFCWGSNGQGQLGLPSAQSARSLTPVELPTTLRFTHVAAGSMHTCALTAEGVAHCWGAGVPLGDSTLASSAGPVRVAGGHVFASLTAGDRGTCALTRGGVAYCWGANTHGELGTGVFGEGGRGGPAPEAAIVKSPQPVLGGRVFSSLSLESQHACGVTMGGPAFCWGDEGQGRLGHGGAAALSSSFGYAVPTPVAGEVAFAQVSAGRAHSCALATGGAAWCWGESAEAQTGIGARSPNPLAPRLVVGGLRFAAVDAGTAHSCGVTTDGAAYCWGSNLNGALGSGTAVERADSPVPVAGSVRFRGITARAYTTCGLGLDGQVYCWGQNVTGVLGDGTTGARSVPTRVQLTL
jgi:alpha-tubulin suppressor-like RCC1 family protein